MRLSLPIILLCVASASVLADEPAVHTIAEDGSLRPPGYPAAAPHLLALGGKPLRVVWKDPSATAETPASVDRITDTRRVPHTSATATGSNGAWTFEWTPPVTHGTVTYEISIKKEGTARVLLEVRNPDEFQDQIKALKSMEWEAQGLERPETDALSASGFRLRTTSAASTPFLRMTSSDPARLRRNVTWDQTQHDLVVWRVVTAGDIDVRAPRWWISAEALATDEGRIRFLDLFSTSPASH